MQYLRVNTAGFHLLMKLGQLWAREARLAYMSSLLQLSWWVHALKGADVDSQIWHIVADVEWVLHQVRYNNKTLVGKQVRVNSPARDDVKR
jgi:hypothetical protein